MSGTLIDTNVLLDVITEDPQWSGWSSDALASAIDDGPVYSNTIIYAKVSIRFSRIEEVEEALPSQDFRRSGSELPRSCGNRPPRQALSKLDVLSCTDAVRHFL